MVIVSHDREFLDRLCTKIVETEQGITRTFKGTGVAVSADRLDWRLGLDRCDQPVLAGNYTAYIAQKAESVAQHWEAYEKQQKEIARQVRKSGGATHALVHLHVIGPRFVSLQKDLVARLSAGARSGRASTAAKTLQHLHSPAVHIPRPFVAKKRSGGYLTNKVLALPVVIHTY